MTEEWSVYNLYLNSVELFDEVISSLSSFANGLIRDGEVIGFYYNRYNFPKTPPYLRFGCHKIKTEARMMKRIDELIIEGKITRKEPTKPDLTDVDGVVMDKIKLTARKLTETIKNDFEQPLTIKQAVYLVHLSLNNFFGYLQEKEVYSGLVQSMEDAIEKAKSKLK